MNLQPFEETKKVATEKWHEYIDAAKKNNDKIYQDLRKAYNQLRKGLQIIDINKVILAGGRHENYCPKLAIAQARTKNVNCLVHQGGDVSFINPKDSWGWSVRKATDVVISKCFPEIPQNAFPNQYTHEIKVSAPVPMIPAKLLPPYLGSDFYILWEVEEWKKVPPVDPYLLRRITSNFFVVLAGWNLTELERAAMARRMN